MGAAFQPLVSLAVVIILLDGGLELTVTRLKGDSHLVVRRLRGLGIPITWAGAGFLAWLFLGLYWRTAVMLGAILIVSGPTVVTPILKAARPGEKLTQILNFAETTIDPLGAIIAVVVFQALKASHEHGVLGDLLGFLGRVGIGVLGGAIGIGVLWIVLKKLRSPATSPPRQSAPL